MIVFGVLLMGIPLIIYIIGKLLSKHHAAKYHILVPFQINEIWEDLTNHTNEISWRKYLSTISIGEPYKNHVVRIEIGNNQSSLQFAEIEQKKPVQIVRKIIRNRNISGYWIISLELHRNGGTLISINEYTTINNPILRFFFKLFCDPASSIKNYLDHYKKYCNAKYPRN